jgi:hypothetical protein
MSRAKSRELLDSAVSQGRDWDARATKNIAEACKMPSGQRRSRFAHGRWATTHCRGNEPMAGYK